VEDAENRLLRAWSAGSREAGAELIERHVPFVRRFFQKQVGGEVDDLVQQTFMACIEARDRYRGEASFRTFLLAIARNQLLTHYAKQRRNTFGAEVEWLHDVRASPMAIVERRERERVLAEALRRVPLSARVVLELAYWKGCDCVEIARVLDVPLNTAYSRLRRARLALRNRFEQLAPDHGEGLPPDFD
jgi:RNA polymerase sigma-70 factor, ECF subfamily